MTHLSDSKINRFFLLPPRVKRGAGSGSDGCVNPGLVHFLKLGVTVGGFS